jgi:hypothetical protein
MASGEIKLEGAIAYAVGKLDRGFVQMAEMVNVAAFQRRQVDCADAARAP